MTNQPIRIIGGGIGGVMTAIALNNAGIESVIYERSGVMESNGAGLALWANATRLLDRFGLLENLLPCGNLLDTMQTFTSDGRLLNVVELRKLRDKFQYPSMVLLRSDLQRVLLNAIPASQIRFGKNCTRVEEDGNQIRLHFSDGTNETAGTVLFADGIHSRARRDIFKFPPLTYSGRTSWRGIAQFDKPVLPGRLSYELFGKGRRMGIFPLPGNLAYWYAAVNMPEADAFQQQRTAGCVLSHFKGWCEPAETVIRNTPEDRLVLTNTLYTTAIDKLVSGNIALLGDAAHPMTPDLGQGACQAIEDAVCLADSLAASASIPDALMQYEKARLSRVRAVARNSYRMGLLRQLNDPLAMALRDTMFQWMPERFALGMLKRTIGSK